MPRDGERALFSNDPARAARALHLRVDRPPTRRTRENPSLNETHAPLSLYASAITRTNARNLSFPHVARETIATTRETDGGWYETDEPRRRAPPSAERRRRTALRSSSGISAALPLVRPPSTRGR